MTPNAITKLPDEITGLKGKILVIDGSREQCPAFIRQWDGFILEFTQNYPLDWPAIERRLRHIKYVLIAPTASQDVVNEVTRNCPADLPAGKFSGSMEEFILLLAQLMPLERIPPDYQTKLSVARQSAPVEVKTAVEPAEAKPQKTKKGTRNSPSVKTGSLTDFILKHANFAATKGNLEIGRLFDEAVKAGLSTTRRSLGVTFYFLRKSPKPAKKPLVQKPEKCLTSKSGSLTDFVAKHANFAATKGNLEIGRLFDEAVKADLKTTKHSLATMFYALRKSRKPAEKPSAVSEKPPMVVEKAPIISEPVENVTPKTAVSPRIPSEAGRSRAFLRVGLYVDVSNLHLSGGRATDFGVLREFACRGDWVPIRLNAYVAHDYELAERNPAYRDCELSSFDELRLYGFKVKIKRVKHQMNDDGHQVSKANTDLDMAVDALLQCDDLDKVVLATGDGDFAVLVDALQNKGCRVEVVGFDRVSMELKQEADNFFSGFLIPELLPTAGEQSVKWGETGSRVRGVCYHYDVAKRYGFFRFMKEITPNLWNVDTRAANSPYGAVYFRQEDLPPEYRRGLKLTNPNLVFEFTLNEGKSAGNNGCKFVASNIQLITGLPKRRRKNR